MSERDREAFLDPRFHTPGWAEKRLREIREEKEHMSQHELPVPDDSPLPNVVTKYRKKPIVIEAEQFTAVGNLYRGDLGVYEDATSPTGYSIGTLEGKHEVTPGDWIITGIAGEKYPCKPDIFAMTYEPVED